MDYAPGNLFDVVSHYKGIGESGGRFYMKQIVDALQYINKNNVVHRDIKIDNIIVMSNMDAKITDFGFSTYYKR